MQQAPSLSFYMRWLVPRGIERSFIITDTSHSLSGWIGFHWIKLTFQPAHIITKCLFFPVLRDSDTCGQLDSGYTALAVCGSWSKRLRQSRRSTPRTETPDKRFSYIANTLKVHPDLFQSNHYMLFDIAIWWHTDYTFEHRMYCSMEINEFFLL